MDLSQCTAEKWNENEEILMNNLQQSSWKSFPLLNQLDLGTLKDGQLVRFIGMVQDMRSPEYYIESYGSTNKETNERTIKNGKYMEFIKCEDNEIVDVDGRDTVRKELQTFYVISTPGENEWVKHAEAKNGMETVESSPISALQKRSFEEDSIMDVLDDSAGTVQSSSQKRHCNNILEPKKVTNINVTPEYLLNFPVENKDGKACLVKVYENEDKIKLNDICEFVGFLSVDPKLSHECHSTEDSENMEIQMHNPPPSLIPRIHCLAFKKLKHTNPLVENVDIDIQKLKDIRKEVMIVLTQLLLGDEIAAEYLLCHLISEVYIRKDLMALGKFSLNLSNIPSFENFNYVEKLYEFIQLLVPKSYYLPLTVENMNELTFIPKKDYEVDRLNSGLLQLSANTTVVLDETKLQPGKLDPAGVRAVQAIANIIRTQRISYDFNYYPVEFDCDIPFLITSEGKSMLPADSHIVLSPDEVYLETFNEIIEATKQLLKPELLNNIRKYLTLSRLVPYNIEDNVHTLIQNKFIEMRQQGATSDDLHNLLVLNRLICLSYGKNTLDEESWEITCKLEERRKQRLVK